MDPGHHTAFLLAILICILLLLLAASALLMCYWRRNSLKLNQTSSKKFGSLVRDKATSMTSFTLNAINLKHHLQNDAKEPQEFSLPFTVDRSRQKAKHVTSHLSLNSHVMTIGEEEEESHTLMVNKSIQKKSEAHFSTMQHMLSSGASFLGEILEKSSVFSQKVKRRSSSPKSGVDVAMIPLESPVHVSSMNADHFQHAGSLRNLSRSSTLLCENSSGQQFTWNTELSILSKHVRHKESFSLPNTLERKTEDDSSKQNAQLVKPELMPPKTWFISLGTRPLSEGAQLENELNNVTSLDSGVDVIEPVVRNGFGDLKDPQKPVSNHVDKCDITTRGSNENPGENPDECTGLHISHQEAARKLNPKHYSRSLWERREERPLIGVN